jgi:phage portal protein BeeE
MMIMQQTINSIQEEEKRAAVANRYQTGTRSGTPPPLDLILDISAIETYPSFRPGLGVFP